MHTQRLANSVNINHFHSICSHSSTTKGKRKEKNKTQLTLLVHIYGNYNSQTMKEMPVKKSPKKSTSNFTKMITLV